MGIKPARGSRHQFNRNWPWRSWILFFESREILNHPILQFLRGRAEIGTRRSRGIISIACGRGTRLEVRGMREALSDQLRANDLSLFVSDETSIGSLGKEKLSQPGDHKRINDSCQDERNGGTRRAMSSVFCIVNTPYTRLKASKMKSMNLIPMKGAITPPTP